MAELSTIESMNNHEKSVEILKLMGWRPVQMPKFHSEGWYRLADENGNWNPSDYSSKTQDGAWLSAPNLYKPENVVIAWRVLNWVARKSPFKMEFFGYWDNGDLWTKPLETAQAEWLDKVLELARLTTQALSDALMQKNLSQFLPDQEALSAMKELGIVYP